jgi:hypothetical protein
MLARLEQSNQFVRTFFEMRETLALSKKLKLDLRYFAGAFLANNTTKAAYNWRMDGQSTTTDYAYDGEYFDRSGTDEFLSRQFSENHGGFKVPTAIGQSSRGLTALNAKLKLKKFPIGLFGDVGYSISSGVLWDGGIYVPVLPGIIEVYLPLTYSSSIKTEIAVNGKKWFDLIRFQIALDRINPVESVKRFNFL